MTTVPPDLDLVENDNTAAAGYGGVIGGSIVGGLILLLLIVVLVSIMTYCFIHMLVIFTKLHLINFYDVVLAKREGPGWIIIDR